MIDLSFWELMLVGIVALLVIGPKDLPNALRHLGRLTGKARAMTRHVRSGFDEMVRQAEMEEMEKQWREQNARIMAQHPAPDSAAPDAVADAVSDAALPPLEGPAVPPAADPAPERPAPDAEAPDAATQQGRLP